MDPFGDFLARRAAGIQALVVDPLDRMPDSRMQPRAARSRLPARKAALIAAGLLGYLTFVFTGNTQNRAAKRA